MEKKNDALLKNIGESDEKPILLFAGGRGEPRNTVIFSEKTNDFQRYNS